MCVGVGRIWQKPLQLAEIPPMSEKLPSDQLVSEVCWQSDLPAGVLDQPKSPKEWEWEKEGETLSCVRPTHFPHQRCSHHPDRAIGPAKTIPRNCQHGWAVGRLDSAPFQLA